MTLDEAAVAYRQATRNLTVARDASAATRRLHHDGKATARQWAAANQRALDARHALEHARDELVAAALDHAARGVSRQDMPEEHGSYLDGAA